MVARFVIAPVDGTPNWRNSRIQNDGFKLSFSALPTRQIPGRELSISASVNFFRSTVFRSLSFWVSTIGFF